MSSVSPKSGKSSGANKIGYTLLLLAILVGGAFVLWSFFSAIVPGTGAQAPVGTAAKSIADMAMSYYGALSRPLFPEHSLGLPLVYQAVLSLVLVVVTLLSVALFPKARQWVMLLTVGVVLRHLLWRGMDTLDLSTPLTAILSLVVYGAEIISFFALVLGYFQMWGQTDRKATDISKYTPEELPSVDVMICTYNEPISVLYRSVVGAASIDYAKKRVYLLDDGNREEVADMASRLGINYISRTKNEHAKAGNLNNALGQTSGDLIVVFDADHVSCKSFLNETVGFFMEEKLAYVQTPQHFFTPDPFQRNLAAEGTINNEQDLFFHVIQPGNDYWGAAFFAGSGAIFRRQALYDVGGFATETITEDTHTGLRLHAKGWTSAFYNRDLAAGMAQDSFGDFVKQRLRWARGMTQIFCVDNPLLVGGLSFAQRLCYLSGIYYFFSGLPRLIFLIAPLFFLLFGIKALNAGFVEVLIYYIPSFVALTLGYSIVARGVRQSFWSEVYEVAMCIYMWLTTTLTMLWPKRAKFMVTPKGGLSDKMSFNWQIVLPQLLLVALTILGIGMAIARSIYTPEYTGGIYTNLFWSLYNLVLLVGAIYVAQERPQFRLTPRIYKQIRAEVRLLDGTIAVGYTTNISESGMAVVFEEPIPVSGTIPLKLLDWDISESSVYQVQAIRSSVDGSNRHYIGFRVVNRTDEQHQQLIRHMFGNADVWAKDHHYVGTGSSFWSLLSTPLRLAGREERPINRKSARFQSTLSVALELNGQHMIGVSNEISESGMSVMIKNAGDIKKDQVLPIRVQWTTGQITELVAQVVRSENVMGGQTKVGLNFVNLTRQQRLELIQQIYRPRESVVRVAPSVHKILHCAITLPGGQRATGFTEEISEMGSVIALQERVKLEQDMPVLFDIQWDDGKLESYRAVVKGIRESGTPNNLPVALLYFDRLDLKTLDALSARIHQPMESKAFSTLIQ